ncbi:DUF1631 family protein [Chitinilyticum litopenaei]|uniref:DUF1631 family protein n=1 Tax=Chitinilyticum litopenaei TaxID=1121276 RepID=UPI00130E031F|nr:DUF1631 family protein [Chitinilyticum litopenaei]
MDRNDLLNITRTTFLRVFNQAIDGLIARAADTLFGMADRAGSIVEQRDLLDIRVIVMSRQQEIQDNLVSAMERLLNRSYQTAYSTFRPSFSEAFNSQSLSLVDVSAFDGELRIDEITTRMRHSAEEQLRDLNIRMAVLFDQDNINERENPFRPYLLSRCLGMAVETLNLTPSQQDLLTAVLADELLGKVQGIYAELNLLLANHGIAAQLQLRIRQLPGHMPVTADDAPLPAAGETLTAAQAAAAPQRLNRLLELVRAQAAGVTPDVAVGGWSAVALAQPEAPAAQAGGWLASVQGLGQAVRGFFTGGVPARAGLPLTPSLKDSLSELQQTSFAGGATLLDSEGQVRNLILEMRPQLSEASADLNEQMIIDIVGMLFEFILRDGQVPAEIRAQLGRLQLLVLKSALQDPALFSQKHHPARLLVNRIGSIAQGLQQLDPGAERVTAEIRRIIEALLAGEDEGIALFSSMLDELDAFIARELRAANDKVDRAARAMESAESRTLRYARITAQVADALAPFTLDPYLQDFLGNTWAYAIEFAEREDPVSALRYRMLVPELLWSIAPKADRSERQTLLALIPPMLATLNEGLVHTPWHAEQRQALLGWLVEAHRHALRVSQTTATVPSIAELRAQFSDFIGQSAQEPDPASLPPLEQVNPVLLQQAIGEIQAELEHIDLLVAAQPNNDDESLGIGPLAEAEFDELFARLRAGVAIEINIVGSPVAAKLCWMSPNESSMVLTLADQAAPSLLSVQLFRRMLGNGRLRLLEDAPLFERAIESLLDTADSVDALN